MTDIIEEVMTDRKDEQKMFYFKRAIPIVIGLTIVVVIGMIINDYRVSKNTKHNQEIGDTIVNSLENLSSNASLALEGFDFVINNATNHAKDIALLQKLAASIHTNSRDTTLYIAQNIIIGEDYLPLTTAYAKLIWISLNIDSKELSAEETTKMLEYFDSFTEKTAFYGSVHLLEALWYSKTDKDKSKEILKNLISSKIVTNTLKEEAKALMSNLTIEN